MAPPAKSRPLNKKAFADAITNPKSPIRPVLFSESLGKPSSLAPNIRSIAWSPTGSMVATCTAAQIRIWNPERASVKLSTDIRNGHNPLFTSVPGTKEGAASTVEKVSFCPSMDNVLASIGNDGGVRLWDVRLPTGAAGTVGKGTQLADCKLGDSGLSLVWHPEGREMVISTKEDFVKAVDVRRMTDSGMNGTVAGWEMESTDRTPFSPKRRLHGIAFSNSGRELFVTTGEGPVRILDYPSMETLHTLPGHSDATYCAAHSPNGTYLAVGGSDSMVSLWDTQTWLCSHMLPGHINSARDLSFSWDGMYLTAGSSSDARDGIENEGMKIYHVDSGEGVHTVETKNPVTVSAWHPLRYWVAYAGDPGGMKILGAGSAL